MVLLVLLLVDLHLIPQTSDNYIYKIPPKLNDGIWKGKQIVSKKWIKEATRNHKPGHSYGKGYGYNWFPGSRTVNGKTFGFIATFGYGGQFLYIIPEFEIIFALTSDLTDRNWAVKGLVDEVLSVIIK